LPYRPLPGHYQLLPARLTRRRLQDLRCNQLKTPDLPLLEQLAPRNELLKLPLS
jgi:hypothetical protein